MPKPSILLVEDNLGDLQLMREALAVVAHDVTLLHAGDLGSAWVLLTALTAPALPALVITDHHLPDGHGQELISRLQACPLHCHLPVVMLSSDVVPPTDLDGITWFGKPDTWAGWCAMVQRLTEQIKR